MTIEVTCRGCGKTYHVRKEQAGRKGNCKECGGVLEVPAGLDLIEVGGPTTIEMAQMTGKRCPKCDIPVTNSQIVCDECGTDLRGVSGRPVIRSHAPSGPGPLQIVLLILVILLAIGGVFWLVIL